MLKPKLFTTLKDYSWSKFRGDLVAGIIVGIVSLPLAIAFAIASGVSPDKGLFTAIIAGFIISVLGGSRVQIGGPTGAFVVIVYSILQKFGMDGLLIATLMGGIILIAMGLFHFGSIIKFIPYPVVVGFTSGIAVIIFSSQIKDFFGLTIHSVPANFVEKWSVYAKYSYTLNWPALSIGALSLAIIVFWKKITARIPGALIALVSTTVLVHFFKLPVETIESCFGAIPNSFPHPSLPAIHLKDISLLLPSAVTIAVLGGIESLLSAVVSDGMIGGRHRPNMELVAQGIANLVVPFFGGIPATGAIARTATNVHNGGRTPVAGIINVIVLFIIMVFLGKWIAWVPLPCLAAILIMVAYQMSEWRSFLMMLRSPRSDVAVLLATFLLTVFVDLTVAIQVGLFLALLLFMRRMALVTNVGIVTNELVDTEEQDDPNAVGKRKIPSKVEVFEINGPFFFGASYKFIEAMNTVGTKPKIRIIRMRNVIALDATGMHTLKDAYNKFKKSGITLLLADLHTQPLMAMERSGLLEMIGEDNVFGNIDDALNRAREMLGLPQVPRPGPFVPTVARESNLSAA
ncbi:MAG TPA: sulfate permease [Candidatus Omnitrophota bacterium]|nr:sulfate permease [Candidatus Omnitrophota bacterium]HPS36305.1 sulfate permease [Candidatus Omnitrophota bacterium]